jgi:hypothetical protein
MNRIDTEALACRATVPFAIETAASSAGQFRVSGIMNGFGVMSSGRILHPRGFENWLARNPNARLPMLAQHGFTNVGAFKSIGAWDHFERAGRGMRWSGFVAEGTALADETRTLLRQKALSQLSFGWDTKSKRWVSINDKDLDPHYAAELQAAGAIEALAFDDWEPYEGSIVDCADDREARLAASRLNPEDFAALLERVKRELSPELAALQAARGSPDVAAVLVGLGEAFQQWIRDFRQAALDALHSDPAIVGAASEYKADLDAMRAEGIVLDEEEAAGATGGGDLASLMARVGRGMRP